MSVYENKPESKSLVPAPSNPNQQLLDRLIARKEKDLECKVCLITATVSIYSCPESHLVYSECRPKVTKCPECRVEYKEKMFKRHMYAERMLEELDLLRKERTNDS